MGQQSREGSMSLGVPDYEFDFKPDDVTTPSMTAPPPPNDFEFDFKPEPTQPKSYAPGGINEMLQREFQPQPEDDRSLAGKAWDAAFTPLWEAPKRWGQEASKAVLDRTGSNLAYQPKGDNSWEDWWKTKNQQAIGFGAGAMEGIGDVVTSFSTPADLAEMALSGGSYLAGKSALKGARAVGRAVTAGDAARQAMMANKMATAANKLNTAERVASALPLAHGVQGVYQGVTDPNKTWGDVGFSAAEAAGGALGMKGQSKIGRIGDTLLEDVVPHTRGGDVEFSEFVDRETGQPIRTTPISESIAQDPNFRGGQGDPELAGSQPYKAAPEESQLVDIPDEDALFKAESDALWGPDEVTQIADPMKMSDARADDMAAKYQARPVMPPDDATNILRQVEPDTGFIPEPETMPGGVEPPTGAQFSRQTPDAVAHDMSEGPIMDPNDAARTLQDEPYWDKEKGGTWGALGPKAARELHPELFVEPNTKQSEYWADRKGGPWGALGNVEPPPQSLAKGPIPEPPPSPQNPFEARGDVDAIVAQRVREEMAKFDNYVKSGGRPDFDIEQVHKSEPRGTGYRQRILDEAGDGPSGLSVEKKADPANKGALRTHITVRGDDGKPLAAAIIQMGDDGKLAISNLSAAEGKGLGTGPGKALKQVINKAVAMDAGRPFSGVSPDAESMIRRLLGEKPGKRIMEANDMAEYQDLTPDRYKRYTVYDENDNVIHKSWDYDEAHRIADEENGSVHDAGETPVKRSTADELAENSPVLPRDLQGAQPRFAYGADQYTPKFNSDLDKALFIIAQKTASRRDADYLRFAMEHTGLDEAGARAAGAEVRAAIKNAVKGQPSGDVNIPPIHQTKRAASSPTPRAGEGPAAFQQRTGLSPAEARRIYGESLAAKAGGPPNLPPSRPAAVTGGEPAPKPKKSGTDPSKVLVANASPGKIKEMIEQGYEFQGIDKKYNAHFEWTGKPGNAPILAEEVPGRKAPRVSKEEPPPGRIAKTLDAIRSMVAVDPPFVTSAAFRQGAPHMWTKKWRQAWGKALKAYTWEEVSKAQDAIIAEHELFKKRPPKEPDGPEEPSFAEEIGLRLTETENIRKARSEGLRGGWAENIPVWGRHIKASNRAYAAFLNHIRVELLEEFYKTGKANAKAHGDPSLDLGKNIPLAKEFAEFINDSTGTGSLKTKLGVSEKYSTRELNLEASVDKLSHVLFSPRLLARNIRMLNPSTYIMANPAVRKQYLLSMTRSIGSWAALASAVEISGVGEVTLDPRSSDFGKIRIGNTRLDPGAGLAQFAVLAGKQLSGSYTSSVGRRRNYPLGGGGVSPQTRGSVLQEFGSNKFAPVAKLFYDLAFASKREPVYLGDRTLQLFVPMMAADIAEMVRENPKLLPLVLSWTAVGGGSQTYSGERETTKIIPEKWDYAFEGGGWF
jgi:hypothetical protein